MKRTLAMAALAGAVLLTSGCLVAPVRPPYGVIFTDYKAPLDHDGSGEPLGSKSGEASTSSILALVATGDASIQAAAANGGVTNIHTLDYKYFNVLGVYQKYTTIVHGE